MYCTIAQDGVLPDIAAPVARCAMNKLISTRADILPQNSIIFGVRFGLMAHKVNWIRFLYSKYFSYRI